MHFMTLAVTERDASKFRDLVGTETRTNAGTQSARYSLCTFQHVSSEVETRTCCALETAVRLLVFLRDVWMIWVCAEDVSVRTTGSLVLEGSDLS